MEPLGMLAWLFAIFSVFFYGQLAEQSDNAPNNLMQGLVVVPYMISAFSTDNFVDDPQHVEVCVPSHFWCNPPLLSPIV